MLVNYNSSSIKVLKGLDAVRKRPGMYIGDTSDDSGVHNMVFEVIDNSIDEVLSGYCNEIILSIYKDNSISVFDNGRGIPTEIHEDSGISAAELIMTVLHSGSKFDNNSYQISGGLHGVGVSVVNALSKKLELRIYRNGKEFYQKYICGIPSNKITIIGDSNKHGTFIRFWPDKNIFINFNGFKYSILYKRLNELSYLNNGLNIKLFNYINNSCDNFLNYGGIKSFLLSLVNNKIIVNKNVFYFKKNKSNFSIEFACYWTTKLNSKILCYTNNIYQCDGGTHLSGLKFAITRTVNLYLSKELNLNKKKINIIGDDTREGLYSILSIKMCNPKFSSQTKNKLISSEIKSKIEYYISKNLMDYFLNNPIDSKNIFKKIINSAKSREASKKARELFRKKNNIDNISIIASKLADCQEKNCKFNEIFLVEGDSAGGSAKQSRNRINQAVLPLKGKIINVEKISLDKVLLSKEINILISVLGCGITYKNFNLNKLRYNNVIIMTDADIDGAHIRTLLLTFFYRYMIDLIYNGHIYIARPPLYKIKFNNFENYLLNDYDLIKYKIYYFFKNINLYENNNLFLGYNKLINLVFKYINLIKLIGDYNNKFVIYIFNSLMYFSKLDISNKEKYSYWLNSFSLFLNSNSFYNKKITCKIIFNNNLFKKFKIFYKDFFNSYHVYLYDDFLNNNYYLLLDLGKEIFFFKEKKIYILLNNKKVFFSEFSDLINYVFDFFSDSFFVQRYKGLGEMNPDQLWNTTMDPKNRVLSKIYIEDAIKANKLFNILMGDDIKSRRKFIEGNIIFNKDYNFI